MDPVELLDILGNENRRRILQLLSFRPFYFNEIAKRLDVGPKAVIDHLEMLEEAGLVECYTEQGRRKYFRISGNVVLEVALSPYSYGVRAYGKPARFGPGGLECPDLKTIQKDLNDLDVRRQQLRQQLAELDSKETEIRSLAVGAVEGCTQDQLEMEILLAILSGTSGSELIAKQLEIPEIIVLDSLRRLKERGAVKETATGWSL